MWPIEEEEKDIAAHFVAKCYLQKQVKKCVVTVLFFTSIPLLLYTQFRLISITRSETNLCFFAISELKR